MASTVFTIGYERAGLDQLIQRLREAGVTLLLDVRELPNSRRAGFSKRQLSASLEEAGIGYRHLKALGTPKAGRVANQAGRMAEFWEIVDAALERPEARLALEEAVDLATAQTACMLCVEDDWRTCHRARVGEMLEARGFRLEHLTPDGACAAPSRSKPPAAKAKTRRPKAT